MKATFTGLLAVGLLAMAGCSRDAEKAPVAAAAHNYGSIDWPRLANADAEPQNWFTTGRDFGEGHYSPLDRIHTGNVKELGYAWEYDLHTTRGLEATPIVVDGVLYTSSAWSKVYALDARDGHEIWQYDPKVSGQ